MTLRYAFVADDFTGATDTLATLARAGLATALYLDAHRMATASGLDAVGLATAARSLPTPRIAAALGPAADALRTLRPPLAHYKVCSTFDSAPGIGSIAAAVEVLRTAAPHPFLPIVGGQPNLRRYCLFGNLFAGAGPDGEIHRLDRHPTMRDHPVTPMHEADLRRHLAALGLPDVRTFDCTAYANLDVPNEGAVLFDVTDDTHLARIGAVLLQRSRAQPLLAVGASSVAQAMIHAWQQAGALPPVAPPAMPRPATGPVLVLSGSRSPVSAAQVAQATSYARIALGRNADDAATRCVELLRGGRHVLASVAADAGGTPAEFAAATARLLAAVLDQIAPARIGVSGGDTSSHAMHALGIERLEFVADLQPGVALCRVGGPRFDGMELMLKGGQMGRHDVFERLIAP